MVWPTAGGGWVTRWVVTMHMHIQAQHTGTLDWVVGLDMDSGWCMFEQVQRAISSSD